VAGKACVAGDGLRPWRGEGIRSPQMFPEAENRSGGQALGQEIVMMPIRGGRKGGIGFRSGVWASGGQGEKVTKAGGKVDFDQSANTKNPLPA